MPSHPVPPRLDRNARLLGLEALDRLARAHVVVLGLGGVGSYAAEALARAGVGRLTLVDGERIDETNVNRQLHALDGEVGRWKAEAMAERLRRIVAPAAALEAVCGRYQAESAARLVPEAGVDFVVDAMDTVAAKLHVIDRCLALRVPIVTALGAAGRLDPTAVQVTDLAESHTDQLAKDVRKYLRKRFGLASTDGPTGVLAVWSREPPRPALDLPGGGDLAGARAPPEGPRRRGPRRHGSVAFVTAAFGLAAAGAVVHGLTGLRPATPPLQDEAEARRRRKKATHAGPRP